MALRDGSSQIGSEAKIVGAASVMAVATVFSRLLGFIRDMLFAKVFGATLAADAFYVAYRIPNLLRELFAEGAMSAGFVPIFTEYLTKRSRQETAALVRSVFTFLVLVLVVLVGIGIFFAPLLLSLITPGFAKRPDQFQLAILLTRMMFPYLLFVSLTALTMGILHSTRHFGLPALSVSLFNLAMILSILFPFYPQPIVAVAIGVAVGGGLQWIIQLPTLHQEGFALSFQRPFFPLHPGLIKMAKLLVPVAVALSVTQVNLFVNTIVASTLPEGAVSFLYYGTRLIHFPLGVFGVAIATALLPTLSADAARDNLAGLRQSFSFGLKLIFFIMAPAMIGLILLRIPVVHLLFERGEFNRRATEGVATALLGYAVGLPAFAGVRAVTPVFYALQDTKTPLLVALCVMPLHLAMNLTLIIWFQHGGLALATSLSALVHFLALAILVRKKIGRIGGRQILLSYVKTLLASLFMVPLVVWIATLPAWETPGHLLAKSAVLTATIVLSIALYVFAQAVLKSEELRFLKTLILNKLQQA